MAKNKIDFHEIEEKWRKFWEKEKIYSFDSKNNKKIYSIDTPPPTVSGKMHIGHACSYSQQDFIARFHRMYDGNVFYPFGTDDNGLPTERLVERLKNVKSKNMTRAEFIKLCLSTLKEITPDFVQDWKNLGVSCDYDICYSTIDDSSRKIAQKSFLDLYKKELIYKKDFPSMWCPECQTSVAQAELEDREIPSLFSTLRFSCEGKELLIATTRPELLGACVAVFVNPEDKRYKNLVGKKAKVPLFNYEVPILSDNSAQIDKGTGVLMVCSYGDKYDAEAINKYKLSPKIVIDFDGAMNIPNYKGMKIKEARKKILQDLKDANLIVEQKQINHNVNTHDKCGTEIEFLPTEQWFIKILNQKKKLIANGKKIKWHPKFMFKRYENWVNGLEWDWNISRDRHFGVPIPVWECKKCKKIILAEEKELPVDPLSIKKKCPKCNEYAKPEEKVLDTWATSSLSPQIAYSLSSGKVKLPFSLRPQAHDIIRTWLFYTVAQSNYHENKIPWENSMISGFVTLKGEKMSKSKGNVISPQEVVEKYSADTLRFWAAGSKLGEDLDYQEKELETGKKFITKLMNASNFVFMNLEGYDGKKPKVLERVDELFLLKLNEVIEQSTFAFVNYEYSRAKLEAEKFFWQIFCDNYLEIVKDRVYNARGDKKLSAQYTLYNSLLCFLKLFAPITPFIAEEIYQTYFRKTEGNKSIHVSKWPEKFLVKGDKTVFNLMIETISNIRQEKSKAQKALNSEIILHLAKKDKKILQDVLEDLKAVTKAFQILEGNFKVDFK
jgi:valyl-tRNA synthetase